MELNELIKKTMIQVVSGVDSAQAEMGTLGASVGVGQPLVIRFDVMVTSDDEMRVVTATANEVMKTDVDPLAGVHRIAVEVPFSLPVHRGVNGEKDALQDKKQSLIEQRIERFTSPFD